MALKISHFQGGFFGGLFAPKVLTSKAQGSALGINFEYIRGLKGRPKYCQSWVEFFEVRLSPEGNGTSRRSEESGSELSALRDSQPS